MTSIQQRAEEYNRKFGNVIRNNVYGGFRDIYLPHNLAAWGSGLAGEWILISNYLDVVTKSSWPQIINNVKSIGSVGPNAKWVTYQTLIGGSIIYLAYLYGVYANATLDYLGDIQGSPMLPIGRRTVIYDWNTMDRIRSANPDMGVFPTAPMSQINRNPKIQMILDAPITSRPSISGMALS